VNCGALVLTDEAVSAQHSGANNQIFLSVNSVWKCCGKEFTIGTFWHIWNFASSVVCGNNSLTI